MGSYKQNSCAEAGVHRFSACTGRWHAWDRFGRLAGVVLGTRAGDATAHLCKLLGECGLVRQDCALLPSYPSL